jgi:hypothetical protein
LGRWRVRKNAGKKRLREEEFEDRDCISKSPKNPKSRWTRLIFRADGRIQDFGISGEYRDSSIQISSICSIIFLNSKQGVVVIGGGEVAGRKLSRWSTGASIVLISPDVTPRLDPLRDQTSFSFTSVRIYPVTAMAPRCLVLLRDRRCWISAGLSGCDELRRSCKHRRPAGAVRFHHARRRAAGRHRDFNLNGRKSPGLAARLQDKIAERSALKMPGWRSSFGRLVTECSRIPVPSSARHCTIAF